MTDRAKFVAALLFFTVAMVALATSVRRDPPGLSLVPVGEAKPAPDWTLADAVTSQPVHLQQEAKARPIVLDFWATWCGPCRDELPHIEALSRKYQGRAAFYGINSSDAPKDIATFARQEGLTFPMLIDARGAASTAYGADAIPLLAVIDSKGRLRLVSVGYDPSVNLDAELSKILDSLLSHSQ